MSKKHKGLEYKDIREMDKKKGKKGFVELVDTKGGKIRWDKVEGKIDSLAARWAIREGDVRIGDLKEDGPFNTQLA